ncbi:polysaccharide deacetylase family protein [Belliella sp. DSM 107340]|uniref:Polysaccharide deacetylase family protein n=1 Tax=Belliella calami TaxID=2923436 RepID=A0ABS9UKA0_9BACT|nr:polysaccharide deacetylase family protein [Belliella calami]MCH7396789.1 polysaccharide deacetylase family protein [Belliella calami]
MVIHHVPDLIPKLFKHYTWHKDRSKKKIYLTFDDGPVPEVTEFVLEQLDRFGMKATFFVVGDNVRKSPSLAKQIVANGHGIGNHTYHHLNGYKTPTDIYIHDVFCCQKVLNDELGLESRLFRPPYGRITKNQFKALSPEFEVVMWDVLSGDYDPNQSCQKCLEKTIKYSQNGSIVVFHDQIKTKSVLKEILVDYLRYIKDSGFETDLL